MEAIAIVTILALLEYTWFSILVGKARGRAGISAPTMFGNDDLERHLRVQGNTAEQLIIFIPALWLFGHYAHVLAGAAIGVAFIIGRFMYYKGYVSEPGKRGTGFLISFGASAVLMIGGLVGAIMKMLG